jgi:hypothetical protein
VYKVGRLVVVYAKHIVVVSTTLFNCCSPNAMEYIVKRLQGWHDSGRSESVDHTGIRIIAIVSARSIACAANREIHMIENKSIIYFQRSAASVRGPLLYQGMALDVGMPRAISNFLGKSPPTRAPTRNCERRE